MQSRRDSRLMHKESRAMHSSTPLHKSCVGPSKRAVVDKTKTSAQRVKVGGPKFMFSSVKLSGVIKGVELLISPRIKMR